MDVGKESQVQPMAATSPLSGFEEKCFRRGWFAEVSSVEVCHRRGMVCERHFCRGQRRGILNRAGFVLLYEGYNVRDGEYVSCV